MGSSGGGGRFHITADADPASVLAAVRSSIFQVCKEQFNAEVQRLRPALASGSASESTAALEAAAVVAEADAVLRVRGLADDEAATRWPSRRAIFEPQIKQCQRILAALEGAPPEERRRVGPALLTNISLISTIAYNWCRAPSNLCRRTPSNWCRSPPPEAYRARPASAVVDDLAAGIEAVQVSERE